MCEVGHPIVACQAAVAEKCKWCTEKQAGQQKQSGSGRMEPQEDSGGSRRRQHGRRTGYDLDVK